MINEQSGTLNQARDQVGDQAEDQVGDQVRDQVGDQARDQAGDREGSQLTSYRVARERGGSIEAIEIGSSTSNAQKLPEPVNLFSENLDQSIRSPQPSSISPAENSQLITIGSDRTQNNDQQENDQKKLDQLKRYRDLSIVGALFSTLGLIAGVAMTATQFPVGMISVAVVPFLIAVPLGLLTLSLRILSLTNKNYQQQLSKYKANQQASQQNDARSSNSQNDLFESLLPRTEDQKSAFVGDRQLGAPSPRLLSPTLSAQSQGGPLPGRSFYSSEL